jgi:hypothetical protein
MAEIWDYWRRLYHKIRKSPGPAQQMAAHWAAREVPLTHTSNEGSFFFFFSLSGWSSLPHSILPGGEIVGGGHVVSAVISYSGHAYNDRRLTSGTGSVDCCFFSFLRQTCIQFGFMTARKSIKKQNNVGISQA